jgi:lysozyme family protein
MADLQVALERTLEHEGTYSVDPNDSGGETWRGISRKNHPDWIGWIAIDHFKASNPKWLDEAKQDETLAAQVASFYRKEFWDKIKGDEIQSQDAANHIFDFAVNAGPTTCVKIVQRIVGSNPDGVVGPQTILNINITGSFFCDQFAIEKVKHYTAICHKYPKNKKYFFGWIVRAMEGV